MHLHHWHCPKPVIVAVLTSLALIQQQVSAAVDIGNAATWSLSLNQPPSQNPAIKSSNSVGLASGGGGYQQLVDVGGEHLQQLLLVRHLRAVITPHSLCALMDTI